jgi:hypothetical protein
MLQEITATAAENGSRKRKEREEGEGEENRLEPPLKSARLHSSVRYRWNSEQNSCHL